ncbi:MAG: hypothetical protein K6C95_10030 [Lachnospiraceae bacterium]|nr:hypothetical protein [Lachnospiraceae bacterium]
MPRNLTWVQKLSVTDRNEIERSAGSLRNFAYEEVMPPEISSELQKYAGFLETLAGDEADDREKEKALNGMYAFSSFLYGNGIQITEILEPEKAESFQKLAKAVNDKLDLRINLGSIFEKDIDEAEIDDSGILKIDEEVAVKNNEQTVFTGFGPIVLKKKSDEELAGAPDLLNPKQKLLMNNLKEMKELSEMFNTKKSFRLFNWNSGTYNKAKDTLDAYLEHVTAAYVEYQGLLMKFEQKMITLDEFTTKVKRVGERIDKAAGELRRDMRAYAVHATGGKDGEYGDIGVDGKTQATGAARLSASMGIMSLLDRADVRIGLEPEMLSRKRQDERVNEISFQRLYQRNFKEIEKESDRHRRAASYTQIARQLEKEDAKKAEKAKKADNHSPSRNK